MTDYDDGRVACTDQGITIRRYYFPAGTKRIPYQAIREVRQVRMRPTITPDDLDRLIADLRTRGVNVTSGSEAGVY